MTAYTATLSTGETMKRNSDRAYSLAWAIFDGAEILDAGFARDDKAANSAASGSLSRLSGAAHFNRCTSRRRTTVEALRYHRAEIARMGGVDAWAARIAETKRGLRLELVPAVAA